MDKINLNQIIIDQPDCLTSGTKLRAILLDLYPSESKAIVNTLATMVGAGIAEEIIRTEEITDLDKARWQKKLEDDYGLSEKVVKQCVELFCRKMPLVKSAKSKLQPIMQSVPSDFEIEKGVLIKYKGKSPVVCIPDGVKTIKAWAFMGRKDITSVTIPHSVIKLREDAFSECRNLSEVLISEGVKSIGSSAFFGCSKLTNIILPSTITDIGERAFAGCPLKTIAYNGTTTQWNSVYKGYRWKYNASAIRVTFAREGKDDLTALRYVFHYQMGYGIVENIGRSIMVRFDKFPYKSYLYRNSDLGTILRKVSDSEYFSARKPAEPTPEPPPVYSSYSDNDKCSEEEFDYWNRLCSSGSYEYPDDEHNYTDEDITDDEYDYTDDYDFSDADYTDDLPF